MIATELRMLPNGFVRCDAGCDEIGEHNGRPCITCGGLGYHRNPKTSACPTQPPKGQADPKSRTGTVPVPPVPVLAANVEGTR